MFNPVQILPLIRRGNLSERAKPPLLATHPAVDDVFVYGVPAANGAPGEKDVVAAVVLAPEASTAVIPELFAWRPEALDRQARPVFIQVVAQIPKTVSEKPQEHRLIELFCDQPETVYTSLHRAADAHDSSGDRNV